MEIEIKLLDKVTYISPVRVIIYIQSEQYL